jgi:SRSO17 transposase
LQQIGAAVEREIPQAPVLADAAYGTETKFREGVTALGLTYVVGIQSSVTAWKPGEGPLPKRTWKGNGRPPKLLRRDPRQASISVKLGTHTAAVLKSF